MMEKLLNEANMVLSKVALATMKETIASFKGTLILSCHRNPQPMIQGCGLPSVLIAKGNGKTTSWVVSVSLTGCNPHRKVALLMGALAMGCRVALEATVKSQVSLRLHANGQPYNHVDSLTFEDCLAFLD